MVKVQYSQVALKHYSVISLKLSLAGFCKISSVGTKSSMKSYVMKLCKLLCLALTFPLYLMRIVGLYSEYKRLFPLLAYNITFSYNEKMHEMKRELFRNVSKFANSSGTLRLLEIGCGSGANFGFYPDGCTVICTDPNPHFLKYLRMSMEANEHLTYEEFRVVSGEDMEGIEDESVDVVVCTLVLCSVNNVQRVLQEARRVLRAVSFTVLHSNAVVNINNVTRLTHKVAGLLRQGNW